MITRSIQLCWLAVLCHLFHFINSSISYELSAQQTSATVEDRVVGRAPETTSAPLLPRQRIGKRVDLWYECGYCCDSWTLSCNNGAYCKAASFQDGGIYGYCSTINSGGIIYTTAVDYTRWSSTSSFEDAICWYASRAINLGWSLTIVQW